MMRTEDLLLLIKAKKNLRKALDRLKDEDTFWSDKDLLLFADLRETVSLFDYEFENIISKRPNYNKS